MKRKKILITIDWFLPGTNSGGPVRSYTNMIAHLGKYHDFYVITRDTDYCSDEVYATIQSNTWNQFNEHTSIYYISEDQLNQGTINRLLKETSFDIAYINGIYSWYFSILPLWFVRNKKTVIVAARGMLNPQAFSVKKSKKNLFLTIAKMMGLYKNIKFHATNEDEAAHIKHILGHTCEVMVAPNLPRFPNTDTITKIKKSHPTTFVNIARISIEKGTLKMIDALQHVSNDLILDLFGPIYDQDYWNLCQKSIDRLPRQIQVTYKGILPSEEVPSVLQQYDFFVLLSEGENFGHAILEALMAGCPVIISDQTPWKDLKSKGIGWDLDLGNSKLIHDTFVNAIMMSNEDYELASTKAKQFSKQFSENPEILMLNLSLFNS